MGREKHKADAAATERAKAKTKAGHIELGRSGDGRPVRVECYVLEDGRRLISRSGAVRALTGIASTNPKGLDAYLAKLPSRFADLSLRPEIVVERVEGGVAYGREARWFIEVCNAYIDAREAGELHPRQLPLAAQAQRFVSAAAVIGIEALVDEATGYQPGPEDSVATRFMKELFRENPRDWDRFWPKDVVAELCRTFRIRQTQAFPAPLMGVIGKLYNLRLGEEAHEELKRINPRGADRDMHFQHFGDRLFEQFSSDMGALRALLLVSSSKDQFWDLWTTYCTGRGQLRLGW
ncbi:hypothetical protein [Sorangium sp. So ce1024]|uniref:hypothetical protein n=1 Tax=Sorangium sp. So ce1024 TaxID=3133327 RepID=UPI003F07AD0B